MEKPPSAPVEVPVLVPSTITVAPMIGSPDASATVPLTFIFWAVAVNTVNVIASNTAKVIEKRFE